MNDAEANGFDPAVTRELFYLFSCPAAVSIKSVDSGRGVLIGRFEEMRTEDLKHNPIPG